jgi:hypothetical protein
VRKLVSAAAAAFVLLAPLSATAFAAPASAATHSGADPRTTSSNGGAWECLTSSGNYCLDLKDNHFAQHQPLWMQNKNSGNGLGFITQYETHVTSSSPFSIQSLNTKYNGDHIYILYKTELGVESPWCLGETSGNVVLDNQCAGTYGDWWVKDGNNLINVLRSDYEGGTRELVTAYPTNDEPVKVGTSNGNYHQWNFQECPGSCHPQPQP